MRYILTILILSISIFSFGQNFDDIFVRINNEPLDSLPKYVIIVNETEYFLDTLPDSIKPEWIKKIEILKSEEQKHIYADNNGIALIYPHETYLKEISLLLDTIPNSRQQIDRQLLDSIYVVALNTRFDLQLTSGQKFIEPNKQTERIKNNFNQYSVYKFLSSEELFDYAYKHGKTLRLYRITHKQISKDTIDVNFGYLTLTVKKGVFFKNGLHFKEANYALDCGAANGYIPDFRFAYNKVDETWGIVDGKYKLSN